MENSIPFDDYSVYRGVRKISRIDCDESQDAVMESEGNSEFKITIKNGKIISFHSEIITEVGDNFLYNCKELQEVYMPNLVSVGNDFLESSKVKKASFPKLQKAGDSFLYGAIIEEVDMPNLSSVGNYSLRNSSIQKLSLPNLKNAENYFLYGSSIAEIDLPNLVYVGRNFLENSSVKKLSLPNLKKAGDCFLSNIRIREVDLPNLVSVGRNFLENSRIEKTLLPKLQKDKDGFGSIMRFEEELYNSIDLKFLHSKAQKTSLKIIKKTGDFFLSDPNYEESELLSVASVLESISRGYIVNVEG